MEITLRKKEQFHPKQLVLGTAGLGGAWHKVNLEESVEAIKYALANGLKIIDTAPSYADAEAVVGQAIKGSGYQPIISTKTGRLRGETAYDAHYDYSPKAMEKSVINSLKTLGVEVLDILFLHDPMAISDHQIAPAVDAMRAFKQKGYTKAIGLGGNFNRTKFYEYLNEDCFTVFQGYNRFNLLSTSAAVQEFDHCTQNGVMIYAASPLFMGLLGNKYETYQSNKPEWIEASIIKKAQRCKKMAETLGMKLPELAHRFLFSCAEVDRLVIGASVKEELENTLQAWKEGPLEANLFQELLKFAHTNV